MQTRCSRSVFTRAWRGKRAIGAVRDADGIYDRSIFFDTCSATPIARLEPFCLDNCITVGLIPCFERKNPFLFRHDSNVVIRIG